MGINLFKFLNFNLEIKKIFFYKNFLILKKRTKKRENFNYYKLIKTNISLTKIQLYLLRVDLNIYFKL